MRGKCCNKKAYIKVEGEDSDADSSSEGKSDHLSYSYSCVKSFRKNQHILGDLAALHNQQVYQGSTHQPALYSLSGERNRPVCQASYCSTVSEKSNSSDEEHKHECGQKHQEVEKEKHLSNSESQHQFPVKDMLMQWLKHQFKQVNSLWSFKIPKDIFKPKFCKRNQKMKIEMTLNGVDEETKQRLIDYINKSNLGFEEHCNLCTGNETVFEVDVTSILDDPFRLQNFLIFLKSIDSEKSKVPNGNVASDLNDFVAIEHTQERINITGKYREKKEKDYQTKSCRKSSALEENLYKNYSLSAISTESSESFIAKENQCSSKKDEKDETCVVKIDHPKCECFETKKDTNHQILKREVKKIILPKCEKVKSKEVIQGKNRTRQISTMAGGNDVQHFCDQQKPNFGQNNKFSNPKKFHFEQNVFRGQTNIVNNKTSPLLTAVKRELSCKCLMHDNREDFYRYKNQCLFGKGDEINNSFIKYVNQRENKPESSLHWNENQTNFLPEEIAEETLKVVVTHNRPVEKIIVHDLKNLKNGNLNPTSDLNAHKRVPIENFLNPQDQNIDDFKEAFCLNVYSSSTTDDDMSVKKDLKLIAKNACFKSVSYCLNSFPNTNTSHESSERGNANRYESWHEKNSDVLETSSFEPTSQLSSAGAKHKGMRTRKAFANSCDHNIDFGNGQYLPTKAPDSNLNTLINKKNFKNARYKTNAIINNERELKECNCDKDYVFDRDVEDNEKLHGFMSNTCESNKCQISNESHSDFPTSWNDNHKVCPEEDENKCCIFGCDCEKSQSKVKLRKSKIKTIMFRIGSSNKELKISSIPSSTKRNSKLKSLKPKEVRKKISSVFKGNESSRNEEYPRIILNEKADNAMHYSSIGDKSLTHKSDTNSSSWFNYEDYSSFIGSLTSRSKGTTQTQNSTNVDSSSLFENSLVVLLSELKNQRKEINYMKNLLSNQIT